jgi:hypothetical protein
MNGHARFVSQHPGSRKQDVLHLAGLGTTCWISGASGWESGEELETAAGI